jgi:single-strand DNA-binding protein
MSNVFSCTGTVVRDAEVKDISSGKILSVTVANNVGYGDKQKTNFVRVNVFGKRAEGQLSTFLKKGQQVFVSGELTLNQYETKDGKTGANLELVASIVDLVGGKSSSESKPAKQAKAATPDDDMDMDIPF